MSDVSVIGLGQMGSVVATLLLKAEKSVTVWNRTPEKARRLAADGARVAATPAEAFVDSPLCLVILFDDNAFEEVLAAERVAGAIQDRLIVNLGTSGPEAARELSARIVALGGRYVDGAIQAAPSQMGQPDTPLLVSGSRRDVAAADPILRILGGNLVLVGEGIDTTAFMDLATLSYVYGSYAGFLHGARIAESVGIDVAVYGRLVQDISPSFGAFFAYEGGVIQSDDFAVTESPLRISVSAVDRILASSRRLGLDIALPALVHDWLGQADREGLAGEELAALIKVLRSRGASQRPAR